MRLFVTILILLCICSNTFAFENNKIVRVGISTNDFSNLLYKKVEFSSFGKMDVFDNLNNLVFSVDKNECLQVVFSQGCFEVSKDNGKTVKKIKDFLRIVPKNSALISINGLKRGGSLAKYEGYFELIGGKTQKDKFTIVNCLKLENYLKGVVPNEMPVYFGKEALKAQTVAARNYVLKPRAKFYSEFDVSDSVASQVYFGVGTSHPQSDISIEETNGIVALHDGDLILALYSSTSGGYTEDYKNAFSHYNKKQAFPSEDIPYLKAKSDNPYVPKLYDETLAKWFYTNDVQTFDNESPYFRWKRVWSAKELENILKTTIVKNNNTGFVSPKVEKGFDFGHLKNISVRERGESGKIISMIVEFENASFLIKKELIIRKIFLHSGKILPSANCFFELEFDNKEIPKISNVIAFGAGLGHGVGMSQYGASSMARHGYDFEQILKHYYKGIKLGTMKAPISNIENEDVYDISFFTNNKRAKIIFENRFNYAKIQLYANGKEKQLFLNPLMSKSEYDISDMIKKGENCVRVELLNDKNSKKISINTHIEFED